MQSKGIVNESDLILYVLLKSVRIPPRNEGFLRPIGMFKTHVSAKFILCYDTYGLYVDRRGDPFPDMERIKWEATAERVALLYPYLLLFSSGLIEIREILSGKLVQKIPGKNMRCIWDGREVGVASRTQQAHAVINVPDGNETRYEIIEVAPVVHSESTTLP
ncbi:signal transducer [Moniliophthora roreri]|nr:signal transducer [Moniliophthora roreri]